MFGFSFDVEVGPRAHCFLIPIAPRQNNETGVTMLGKSFVVEEVTVMCKQHPALPPSVRKDVVIAVPKQSHITSVRGTVPTFTQPICRFFT
jgi:hypothetical protein